MGATLSQPESFKNCSKTSDSDVQLCTAGKVRKNMMEKYIIDLHKRYRRSITSNLSPNYVPTHLKGEVNKDLQARAELYANFLAKSKMFDESDEDLQTLIIPADSDQWNEDSHSSYLGQLTRNNLCIEFQGAHLPVDSSDNKIIEKYSLRPQGTPASGGKYHTETVYQEALTRLTPGTRGCGGDTPGTSWPACKNGEFDTNTNKCSEGSTVVEGNDGLVNSKYCRIGYLTPETSMVCSGLTTYANIGTTISTIGSLSDGQNVGLERLTPKEVEDLETKPVKVYKRVVERIFMRWVKGLCRCASTNLASKGCGQCENEIVKSFKTCKDTNNSCPLTWGNVAWAKTKAIGIAPILVKSKSASGDLRYHLLVVCNYDATPSPTIPKYWQTMLPLVCAAQDKKYKQGKSTDQFCPGSDGCTTCKALSGV